MVSGAQCSSRVLRPLGSGSSSRTMNATEALELWRHRYRSAFVRGEGLRVGLVVALDFALRIVNSIPFVAQASDVRVPAIRSAATDDARCPVSRQRLLSLSCRYGRSKTAADRHSELPDVVEIVVGMLAEGEEGSHRPPVTWMNVPADPEHRL